MTAAVRRRGTAPLELVLVFPFLVMLMVCGWWAASAGIAKTAATADARYAAWAKRPEADPQKPFGVLVQEPDTSLVEADRERPLARRAPFVSDAPTTAPAHAAASDRPWDWVEEVNGEEKTRFRPTERPMHHHKKELKQVSQFVPTVDRFVHHLGTARELDLMRNGEFAEERADGPIWKGRREAALDGMVGELGTLASAIEQTSEALSEALAAQLYPLAAVLAVELGILIRGTAAIGWLRANIIARDAPSGRGHLTAREERVRTRRLPPARERQLETILNGLIPPPVVP